MKKIITLVLAIALVFSMATANFSVNAELKNFFDMEAIDPVGIGGGEAAKKEVDGETVYSVSKIDYRWCSAGFDILPALKTALGNDDFIEVTLVFEIKADWTDAFAGHKTSAKPLMRAYGCTDVADSDAWNSAYEDALDGAEAVFTTTDGKNVVGAVSTKRVPLNDEGWTAYTIDMYFEKAQLECDMTPQWIFCIDEMNGAHQPQASEKDSKTGKLIMFDEVLFRNIGIYYTEDYLAEVGTPTPEPTPVPTATPEPDTDTDIDAPVGDEGDGTTTEATPAPTVKPTAKPTATAAPNADNTDDDNADQPANLTWLWIVLGAVAVVAVVVVVIVVTKKKAAPAEEAADETTEE